MALKKEINMSLNAKMTTKDAANFLGVTPQAIHKSIKTNALESYKSQNRIFFGHETAKQLLKLKFQKQIIAFQVVKGGTGKTSLAHSFAIKANLYGAKVLCIDLDQQGNLTQAFGVDAKNTPVMIDILKDPSKIKNSIVSIAPGISIMPSRIENAVLDNFIMLEKYGLDRIYSDIFKKLSGDYDIIIIDCPPALGQSVAAATLASDLIIAPLTPEQFSLSGLQVTYEEVANLNHKFGKNVNIKIVLNKFDSRTALSNEVLRSILNHDVFKNMLCETIIRASQEFPNSIYAEANIFHKLKDTPAKEDIDLLTREILNLNPVENKEVSAA
jgi:chromosome partitioning protein